MSNPQFTNNPSIRGKEDKYLNINVDLDKVIKSWRQSLFSFEWLLPDGSIRKPEELIEKERIKYELISKKLNDNEKLAMPILGIGVMDNIEIGSGREHVLTLYSKNIKIIPVHIPKNAQKDFESFIVE
jgi:hypothetical protein